MKIKGHGAVWETDGPEAELPVLGNGNAGVVHYRRRLVIRHRKLVLAQYIEAGVGPASNRVYDHQVDVAVQEVNLRLGAAQEWHDPTYAIEFDPMGCVAAMGGCEEEDGAIAHHHRLAS